VSTILLIEDTADDEALALEALRRSGVPHALAIARDGTQALELLLPLDPQTPPLTPAFVLLDLKMPRLSGLDVLRRLRIDERTRALPVVVLTTSREPSDIAACYECGANSYIAKPVDFDAFVRAMQQIANYWLRLNEIPGELPGR
jgi:two-component system response regulator